MRLPLHFAVAAFVVVLGVQGVSTAIAADHQARSAVAARQTIREELSAALAKGRLSHADEYRILLHAKEILTPADFNAFEQTMDRIASSQARPVVSQNYAKPAIKKTTKTTKPVEPVASQDDDAPTVVPSQYQETKAAGSPSVGEIIQSRETPFVEETPANIGRPSLHLEDCDAEATCEPCGSCGRRRWFNCDLFSSVDAFKGPVDVGNANGNFGYRLGVNSAVAIAPRLGIGLQAGVAEVLSNIKGIPYPVPSSQIRSQFFTTIGAFQRLQMADGDANIGWGFVYDWLFDDYYSNFTFGQWRAKMAIEFSPCNEFGAWVAIPERGATGQLLNVAGLTDDIHFRPMAQGCLYWKHTWCNEASVTGRFGVAERPGEFVAGAEGRAPLTENMALTGGYTYIMPNEAGGPVGQTQEVWNLSIGIEIVPGGFHRGCGNRFLPFLPVADNGTLAIHEVGP